MKRILFTFMNWHFIVLLLGYILWNYIYIYNVYFNQINLLNYTFSKLFSKINNNKPQKFLKKGTQNFLTFLKRYLNN